MPRASTRLEVVAWHDQSYPDPISVDRGDVLRLTGRRDIWDGHRWVWATALDGRAGWVPDSLPSDDTPPVANFRYSAMELSVETGTFVTELLRTHGWVWCRNPAGSEGWVPERCLRPAGDLAD